MRATTEIGSVGRKPLSRDFKVESIRMKTTAASLAALMIGLASPAFAQQAMDARAVFDQAEAICQADDGALWGVSLCGPILIVDPATRHAVASQAGDSDALSETDGVFTGVLPDDVMIANTAVDWDGVRWTMLLAPLPEEVETRAGLIAHESWHRIQDQLGLPMASPTPDHLATAEGRIAMRLEWRALAAAVSAPNAEGLRTATRDALIFRAARHAQAGEAGAEQERALELNEGLAEYTGVKLSGAIDPHRDVAATLRAAEEADAFPRMFAYASGPAYGLLLDDAAPGWREGLTAKSDLGALLGAAVGFAAPEDPVALFARTAAAYGGQAVADEELAAHETRAGLTTRWSDRLVAGPVLRLPLENIRVSFDPNALQPLPPHGVVYPTATITDVWGVLTVTDGALIAGDWSAVTVTAPGDGDALSGDGWSLEMTEGWRLAPGARDGDFVLVSE
jgi:hypothetical protein